MTLHSQISPGQEETPHPNSTNIHQGLASLTPLRKLPLDVEVWGPTQEAKALPSAGLGP